MAWLFIVIVYSGYFDLHDYKHRMSTVYCSALHLCLYSEAWYTIYTEPGPHACHFTRNARKCHHHSSTLRPAGNPVRIDWTAR